MRVALVNLGNPAIRPADEEEHLGLGYLAAVARQAGHEVRIVDATAERLSASKALRTTLDAAPDVVGISVIFQETIPETMGLARALRQAGFGGHITIGGHPPTFLHRELVADYGGAFDSVVAGEGEETFAGLLAALEAGRDWTRLPGVTPVATGSAGPTAIADEPPAAADAPTAAAATTPRPLIPDLDTLPFPARDTLPHFLARTPGLRVASVLRSRGCYGNCSFCDTRAFYAASPGAAWRVRGAASVVDEIEALVRDHGIQAIRFWDDNFMGPGERGRQAAEDLARELIRRRAHATHGSHAVGLAGLASLRFSFECRVTDIDPDLFRLLKEAGLHRLFLGVEAMNQRQLDFFNKKVAVADNRRALQVVEELGLDAVIGMIMFDPDTTVAELEANLAFLKESFGGWGAVRSKVARPWNRLEVYAGTPVEAALREQGRLKGSYTRYDYDFADPTVARLYFSGAALRRVGLPIRDALSRLRRRA